MANYIHQVQTADGTVFDLEASKVINNVNIKTINNTTMVGNGNISLPTFGAVAAATSGFASMGAVVSATVAMATIGYVDEKIAAATSSLIIDTPFVTESHGAIVRKDSINTITISTTSKGPIVFGENNIIGNKRADYALVIGKNNTVANSNMWTDYAIVAGHSNTVTWGENLTIGYGNDNKSRYGLVAGRSLLTTSKVAQAIVGQWNESDSAAQFMVGVGADPSNRANSLVAYASGVYANTILAPTASSTAISPGSTGQILSSTGNGLKWITNESDTFVFQIEHTLSDTWVLNSSIVDVAKAIENNKKCFCSIEDSSGMPFSRMFQLTSQMPSSIEYPPIYRFTGEFQEYYPADINVINNYSILIACTYENSEVTDVTITVNQVDDSRFILSAFYSNGQWTIDLAQNRATIDKWYKSNYKWPLYLITPNFEYNSKNYTGATHILTASSLQSILAPGQATGYGLAFSADATIYEIIEDVGIPATYFIPQPVKISFSATLAEEDTEYVTQLIHSFEFKIINTISSSNYYGTSDTAAATFAKTATVAGLTVLETGLHVTIKFTYNNTATDPTLNVNSLGAKEIRLMSSIQPSIMGLSTLWYANSVVTFVYDGTYWLLLDWQAGENVAQENNSANANYRVLLSNSASDSNATSHTKKSGNLTFNPSTKVLQVGIGGQIKAPTVYATTKVSTNLIETQNGDTIQATQGGLTISPDTALIVGKGLNSLTVNSSTITLSYNGVRELVIGNSGFSLYDDYGDISSTSSGLNISSNNLFISSTDSTHILGDYVTVDDGYNNEFYMDDTGIGMYSGYNYIRLNDQTIIPTVTLYFGQGGLYKDATRTTLYTTADFAHDIMDRDPQLYVDGGGDSSRYPATYYYEKNGSALDTARITCLVNEANTLYTAAATYSVGTEIFTISSSLISKVPTGGSTGQVLTKLSGTDYAIGWATPSGGGSAPITGSTNPTTSTQGDLGQMYLNTTTELMYVCTYATSGTYHWKPITFESAESQVG